MVNWLYYHNITNHSHMLIVGAGTFACQKVMLHAAQIMMVQV